MRVYCTGRHSEPHDEQPVPPVITLKGAIYECALCKYDVHVDRRTDDSLALFGGDRIELHCLAQVATQAKGESRD